MIYYLRLLGPFNLRVEFGRLETAKQRLVTSFRREVVGNDKKLLPLECEFARERLATVIEGGARRIDSPRTEGKLRAAYRTNDRCGSNRITTRTVYEAEAPINTEEKSYSDVASRLAPVLVIYRVDVAKLVARASPAWIAAISLLKVSVASTTESFVGPLLS